MHFLRPILTAMLVAALLAAVPLSAQEVFRISYTVQDKRLGLVQPEAASIIRNANNWLTRDNPNVPTARLDDPLRVTLTGFYSPATLSFNLQLTQMVMGTIVVERGLDEILDSTQRERLVRRTLFWRDEETTVSGTSLTPPTLRDTLTVASVAARPSRAPATATVEWSVGAGQLATFTRLALERYHLLFARDTFRVRYLRTLSPTTPLRLRARFTAGDTAATLLNVRLGQSQIYGPAPIRTALGDDLVDALIASVESGEDRSLTPDGLPEAHNDWSRDWNAIAALDRVDLSIAPELRAYVSVGDPRHNGDGWLDGTGRVGVTTSTLFGSLLSLDGSFLWPLAGGARAIGPLRERLLDPALGGALSAQWGLFRGAVRYSVPSQSEHAGYVHTWSAEVTAQLELNLAGLPIRAEGGAEFEQYESTDSTITRPFPYLLLGWRDRNDLFRVTFGVANRALRSTAAVRIGDRFWLELRGFWNEAFGKRAPFEHPAMVVFTPRLYF